MSAASQLNASPFPPSTPALTIQPTRRGAEVLNRAGHVVAMLATLEDAQEYIASQAPASAPAPAVEQAAHSAKAQALAARSLRLGASRVAVPSQSEAGHAHEVIKDSTGFVCGCKGFSFRGRCIHQEVAAIVLEAEQAPRPVKYPALVAEVAALDAAGISNVGASLLGW